MVSMTSNSMVGMKHRNAQIQKQNSQPLRFTGKKDSEYENPIKRKTEKTLAALGAGISSIVVAGMAGFMTYIIKKDNHEFNHFFDKVRNLGNKK